MVLSSVFSIAAGMAKRTAARPYRHSSIICQSSESISSDELELACKICYGTEDLPEFGGWMAPCKLNIIELLCAAMSIVETGIGAFHNYVPDRFLYKVRASSK